MGKKKEKKVIRVKLLGKSRMPIKFKKGDWIDLCSACDVELKQFESANIPLGICMQLPKGYEALIVPRSSTFSKYGIIQTNGAGVIDESFCGDNDQWFVPVVSLKEGTTTIPEGARICQFRILKKMGKNVEFERVEYLSNSSRGSCGSTGETMDDLIEYVHKDTEV